jgi:hypothetical protein
LGFWRVEHRPPQAANVFEQRRAGDAAVVDVYRLRAGVAGELLAEAIPRRPAIGV